MDLGKVKKYCLIKSRFIAAVYGGFYCLEESQMAQEARLVIVIDSERAKRTAQDLSVELDSITKKGISPQNLWTGCL